MSNLFDVLTNPYSTLSDRKQAVFEITSNRLCFLLQESEVPQELSYIVDEVSIKRFNRLTNEGMKSYSEDGLSITFEDDDFSGFWDDINRWLERKEDKQKSKYTVRFL